MKGGLFDSSGEGGDVASSGEEKKPPKVIGDENTS